MTPILLATSNRAKLARLRWLLEGLPVLPRAPGDLPPGSAPRIAEDGHDFAANAAQKALGWSAAAGGLLTLASDGGLEIPALGARWQALRTRRNAGPTADGTARIRHLLALMHDLRGGQRRARWHEAIALARGDTLLHSWTAESDGGLIVDLYQPGRDGDAFWTESIRYYPAAGKLYRDLSPEELEALDGVWPRLRAQVHGYLASLLQATSSATITLPTADEDPDGAFTEIRGGKGVVSNPDGSGAAFHGDGTETSWDSDGHPTTVSLDS